MKFFKKFNSFINEKIDINHIYAKIGDYVLTRGMIDSNYKDKISQYYGHYDDDTIIQATYTLRDIETLYDNGGDIYRAVWLKDINDFDEHKLGHHWVCDIHDVKNIIETFQLYKYYEGDAYIIKAYTPIHNVAMADDYWNNLNENEIKIIDDSKLKFISIEKFN